MSMEGKLVAEPGHRGILAEHSTTSAIRLYIERLSSVGDFGCGREFTFQSSLQSTALQTGGYVVSRTRRQQAAGPGPDDAPRVRASARSWAGGREYQHADAFCAG